MTLSIGGIEIGGDNPCRFVAEISNNHNGDFDRCVRLIDAAKAAGADFVKFQCFLPSELVELRGDGPAPEPWGAQGYTMRSLYEKAHTPLEWFERLARHCEMRAGIPWFSSVFGPGSLALLRSLDCPAYKIARLDNARDGLVRVARETGNPLIVSESAEFESVADHSIDEPTLFLYCPRGYPQERFALAGRFEGTSFAGFSFHGTDPLPCVVAATLGAKLIEAHFQLDDEPSELEANVSLTASQFRRMVDDVRAVEEMLT